MTDERTAQATALMLRFAERTGLSGGRPPRRYLWTDAFAVCNFLGLERATGEVRHRELALRLVDQVHHTLGRHRPDDVRRGWISGLDEHDGQAHPTRGGLRIGKELPERAPGEAFDEGLEWERDGQYFHYLTRWMHALDQLSRATGDARFNRWARELAASAHHAFSAAPSACGPRRMYWKMSIDLARVLVPSMGQHDPLDGYITALQLSATATRLPQPAGGPDLRDALRDFAAIAARGDWESADPLGIGGLLADAGRVAQLAQEGAVDDEGLLERLLAAARAGLDCYAASGQLRDPAQHRLAFRELGLAIGLHAVPLIAREHLPANPAARAQLDALLRHVPLGNEIESFWCNPAHRAGDTWRAHRDINEVMLATRLLSAGFLLPPPPPGHRIRASSARDRS